MTVTNKQSDAIAHGKISEEPLRKLPGFPTWAMKLTMAITGLIFGLFVIVHMIGNLKVFMGAEHFDAYAAFLRTVGEPAVPKEGILWVFRIVLLVSLILHVYCAFGLKHRAARSRGKFARKSMVSSFNTFTARSMITTGAVLLLFIIFHILDLTLGVKPLASDSFVHGEAYMNLVASFERPIVAIFYILAMIVLFLHLSHGVWTATSDLGITGHRTRQVMLWIAYVVPAIVMIGNISIPLAVMTGVVS